MIMTQSIRFMIRAFAGIVASVAIGLASSAFAADGTWTNLASGGLWSNSANWQDGTIADNSGFAANFNTLDIAADNTVHLDSDRTLTSLIFGDTTTSSAGDWILGNNGGSTNNLILAGTAPTITVNALGTAKAATVAAIIEGTDGLTKDGVGTLSLSGANTYSGPTLINAGTLSVGAGGASGTLGSGVVTNNGVLAFNRSGALSVSNAIAGSGGITVNSGTFTFSGDNTFTGTVTFNGSSSISVNSFNSVVGGTASSSLGAPIAGKGTIVCGGGNAVKEYIIYTGSGETTDRALTLTSGGAGSNVTLEHSGSGLLKFTGTITRNGNLTCGLTLQGSTEGVGEVSGVIANPGGFLPVTKQGSGTWILSGANTYSRDTTISGGTLLVNNTSGSGTGSASVSVATNATLGGIGMITGTVTVANGGILSPGTNSVGTLTVGTLKLNANATFAVEINGASSYDCCVVSTGTVDIASSRLSLTVAPGYVPKFHATFTIIRNMKGDAVTGTFANGTTISVPGLASPFEISTTGGAGNDVVLRYTGGGGTMIRFM